MVAQAPNPLTQMPLRQGPMRALKTRRKGELIKGASGAKIHVESYGPEEAPPVVLIHGQSGSTYDMSFALAPALEEHFRVYLIDRPGFGHSPYHKDETLIGQARVIREAIAEIEPRQPIVLGQSYGGAVALRWAIDAPETSAGLVLVSSPSHHWDINSPLLHRTLVRPVIGWWAAELIAFLTPQSIVTQQLSKVFAPNPVPEGYADHFQPRNSIVPRRHRLNARQRVALKEEIFEMMDEYRHLDMPIESIQGVSDIIVPEILHAKPLDARVESNHLVRLEGVGHMPHHVATDDVVQAVHRAQERIAARCNRG
ncbi:alpha/beta fold hydrolase [Celeribacter sp. ULVN23_4]